MKRGSAVAKIRDAVVLMRAAAPGGFPPNVPQATTVSALRSAAAATRARDRRCVRDRPPEARVEASEDDLLVRRRAARSY